MKDFKLNYFKFNHQKRIFFIFQLFKIILIPENSFNLKLPQTKLFIESITIKKHDNLTQETTKTQHPHDLNIETPKLEHYCRNTKHLRNTKPPKSCLAYGSHSLHYL